VQIEAEIGVTITRVADQRPPPPPIRVVTRAAGRVRQGVSDLLSQTSGIVLIALCAAIFVGAAIGGLSMVGTLGTFGWIAYVVVLAVLGLSLGPVLASGVTIRRKGSAHHRELMRRRIEAQRRRFALDLPPNTDSTRAPSPAVDPKAEP
jgi:hypothetical protein